jgi:hypothetical protein
MPKSIHLAEDLLDLVQRLAAEFLVFSISASLRCTSSPMYLMSAFCGGVGRADGKLSSATGRNRCR